MPLTVESAWSQSITAVKLWADYKLLRDARSSSTKPCDREIKLRNKLIELNRNLARKVAHKVALECPEPYEDLEQLACMGLMKAVERYNPGYSGKGKNRSTFSSFAVPWIRYEMGHYLRDNWDQVKIPRRAIELSSKVRGLQRKMAIAGREADESWIASQIGISADRWRFANDVRTRKPLLSIDEMLHPIDTGNSGDPAQAEYNWVKKAILRIRDPQRSVFMAVAFGKSAEEVARIHKIEVAQVGVWCEEVRVKLQADFSEKEMG